LKTVHSVGEDCLRINRTTARGNILRVFILQCECQVEQMTEIIIVLILTFILGAQYLVVFIINFLFRAPLYLGCTGVRCNSEHINFELSNIVWWWYKTLCMFRTHGSKFCRKVCWEFITASIWPMY